MKKVLVTRDLPDVGVDLLRQEGFEVTVWTKNRPMTQAELLEEARQHDALLCTSADRIDAAFLDSCRHLEIISQFAAGYDNMDVATATRLGVPLGNAPHAMSEATADVAFGLMIAVSRKMFHLHKKIINGEWRSFSPKANLGMELKNKTLGIFGLGRIGLEMARRCKGAYNMEVIYCNRNPNPEAEKEVGARRVSFNDLLMQSDVLSVHCLLSGETTGIFNSTAFSRMKRSAIFINTARGGVHQEKDLIRALKKGDIWGAGLDVTNPEPMQPNNPLLAMENVAVLPHIGSATVEARSQMSWLAAANIVAFYKGEPVPHLVNPEVKAGKPE
ncbi:2-hydroxyacid dehydrogenase [Botryobacter ruber]|uniref:2-hydroxyacid dehydrogenase n=1 Tax=Botryobacter ruber TaxID=2171629 RepID=UPI000E0C2DCC|nr:D-glycerate dehydrogenase [Botryobacter ruber]